MLLLAIDTAHKNGSIALAQADNARFQLLQMLPVEGGAFSAQLVPRIAQTLAENRFEKTAIDAYIACVGPGSFTGLRIGLSGIKGLAEVLPRPIVPVSSLEALAASAPQGFPNGLLAVLDAGRSEFYVGEYRRVGERVEPISESLCTSEGLSALLRKGSTAVASQSAVVDFVRAAGANVIRVSETTSAEIAAVGWRKLIAGETIAADALDANYLRRDTALFAK